MATNSVQHHAVRSMRLDMRLTDPQLARGVQEALSQLAQQKLLGEMEAVFSAACQPGQTRRLEQIVVDLGRLRLEHLEEDFLERFAPRLQQALGDALRTQPEEGADAAAQTEASSMALFEHLLRHGALPWWAGAHAGSSLEDLFLQLAAEDPAAAEQIILRLGASPQVRLRLVRQFSPAALAALVELLEPTDAAQILQCAERLDVLHQQSPVVPVGRREFYEAKWELMLHTLLEEHGTRFNMKSFLRTSVEGLAQRFAIEYSTLIHHLAETANEPRLPGAPSLIETLLRELSAEAALGEPPVQDMQTGLRDDEPAEGAAADPAVLREDFVRCFDAGPGEGDAGLVRAWRAQSRAWQRALWAGILSRSRADDVACKLAVLFPAEMWEEVQQTLPHPFDAPVLQALQSALGGLHASAEGGGWRRLWWQRVFAVAMRRRGSAGRGLGGEGVLGTLVLAGLPEDVPLMAAVELLLAQPAMQGNVALRRALVEMTAQDAQDGLREDARGEGEAADPALLWENFVRYFDAGDAGAGLAAGANVQRLVRAWRAQSRAWQRALWEAVLFRSRTADVACKLVTLFPAEMWEAVQQTLPHPFDALALQTVQAALGGLHASAESSGWRRLWWQQVFALAMQRRGSAGRGLGGEGVLGTLVLAGLPEGVRFAAAVELLLAQPAIQSNAPLRRALAALAGSDPTHASAAHAALLRRDFPAALKLLGEWVQGAAWPPALQAALPGGPEAWLVWLELNHPVATRALLLRRSRSRHWQRLAMRLAPGVRRRILCLLAPRSAALLLAVMETLTRHCGALLGAGISALKFEENCWALLAGAIPARGAEPEAAVTLRVLRKYMDELALRSGISALLLEQRLRALAFALPSSAVVALLNHPRDWLQAWGGLVGAQSQHGRDVFELLLAVGAQTAAPADYRRLLLAALAERSVVERIVASAGEDFFLWLGTQQPMHWRAEFSAWLDLLEQNGAAAVVLRVAPREWRWRALLELIRWQQQGGQRMTSPRACMHGLLRRLGVRDEDLSKLLKSGADKHATKLRHEMGLDLVGRLKLWRALLEKRTSTKVSRTALWAAAEQDERSLYRELLEERPLEWLDVQRILTAGGEHFLLWVVVAEPGGWRAEFSAWLAFMEQVAGAVAVLPFDQREWRARALHVLWLMERETSAHALHPGTVMLEVLRRLGVHGEMLRRWDEISAKMGGAAVLLKRLHHAPAGQALAFALRAWMAAGVVTAPTRIATFIRRMVKESAAPVAPAAVPRKMPEHKRAVIPQREPATEVGEEFYVENAGLVVLAPFFSRYHEANDLLEDGLFRNPAAAERGVHLLQMLLTDGTAVPEQALVLNKVLCGLSPAMPVARDIDCTEGERTYARTLLQSAIQNWPAVGDLSLDGFRGSFLWRRGKLTRGDERWTLTIEHRGYDVLFSSLPWSFSVIKPLWMPEPLYVEWV